MLISPQSTNYYLIIIGGANKGSRELEEGVDPPSQTNLWYKKISKEFNLYLDPLSYGELECTLKPSEETRQ